MIAGWVGVTGTAGVVAGVCTGAGAGGGVLAAIASASWSYRSTTKRLPYCALGARVKLFGVTDFFRSTTTRRSVGVR
ncbi:hypothetical protein D9M71_558260 [compost metagenome]